MPVSDKFVKESSIEVKQFIQDKEQKIFYESKINDLLKDYAPGDVKNKPKVLKEIARREEERKDQIKNMQLEQDNRPSGIFVTDHSNPNNPVNRELTIKQVKEYMTAKTNECLMLKRQLQQLTIENERLKQESNNKDN